MARTQVNSSGSKNQLQLPIKLYAKEGPNPALCKGMTLNDPETLPKLLVRLNKIKANDNKIRSGFVLTTDTVARRRIFSHNEAIIKKLSSVKVMVYHN